MSMLLTVTPCAPSTCMTQTDFSRLILDSTLKIDLLTITQFTIKYTREMTAYIQNVSYSRNMMGIVSCLKVEDILLV